VSPPTLGLPPRDLTAGYPAAAARLRAERGSIGIRALEIAIARDPTMAERHDELGLRQLLRDTGVMTEKIADCVASDDPRPLKEFCDQAAPVYRRRRVPADDMVNLLEGLRQAAAKVLGTEEQASADRAIDEGIKVFRYYRRIAGDARRRNPILQAIYKGG
jgi:hypothetical protein